MILRWEKGTGEVSWKLMNGEKLAGELRKPPHNFRFWHIRALNGTGARIAESFADTKAKAEEELHRLLTIYDEISVLSDYDLSKLATDVRCERKLGWKGETDCERCKSCMARIERLRRVGSE